jgi:uridine phosphorylase
MIYFVCGASGSGKTACMPDLGRLLPDAAIHDFDAVGVPPGADKVWRQRTTEHWLRRGIELGREGRDLVVCGQVVPGEVLACPSAPEAGPVAACLLDCADVLRIDRLRSRGTYGADQDTLSWAAWQRVHAADPTWRPDVVRDGAWPELRWERWSGWARGDPRWRVEVIDTTPLSVAEVAAAVARWVKARGAPGVAGGVVPLLDATGGGPALIEPAERIPHLEGMPARAVACFFHEVLAALVGGGRLRQLAAQRSALGPHPIYELVHRDQRLAVYHAGMGAPLAVGLLEEVVALGADRIVVCGSAGALDGELALGHVLVPAEAVRDEGTSLHYLPPSRTVAAHPDAVSAIERTLAAQDVPYQRTTTWTTDAFFRETPARIALRRAEGCASVEMEAAALFAVAQVRGVKLGQLLYAGDDLSGPAWDSRAWNDHLSGRERLFWLAVEACLAIP